MQDKLYPLPAVDKLIEMFEQDPKTVLKHGNIWLPISEAVLYRKLSDLC